MNDKKIKELLKQLKELKKFSKTKLITRTIKRDSKGKIISDYITNYVTGETYPTPKRKINPSRRDDRE